MRTKEIAERVRALVVGRYGERIIDAAVGLGIREQELSALVTGRQSTVGTEMLVASLARVVHHFGVDPSWLVTGRYDLRTHLAAEDHRANLIGLRFQIHRLLSGPDWSVAVKPVKRADQTLSADSSPAERAEGSPPQYDPSERTNGRRGRGDEPDR